MRAADFTKPLAFVVLTTAYASWCTILTGDVRMRLHRSEPTAVCAVRMVLADMGSETPPAMEESAIAEAQSLAASSQSYDR